MKFFLFEKLIKNCILAFVSFCLNCWSSIKGYINHYIFSSLTRRILFLNFTALVILVLGVLFLNQFREGLIDARIKSLIIQGEIIAGSIGSSVETESSFLHLNPDKLLEMQVGETVVPESDKIENFDFPINPERISPFLRRLISQMQLRVQIYDRDAELLLDSKHLYTKGQVLQYHLPQTEPVANSWASKIKNFFLESWKKKEPIYKELEEKSVFLEQVFSGLKGVASSSVQKSMQGQQIISVAIPIKRFHAVFGVLVLSTKDGDIDRIIKNERKGILRVFGVAAITNAILSILLASTIANPLRRLSAAAVKIRRSGVRIREKIPDFKNRQDEIGNLGRAVKEMTQALYARIDAIDRFAADVSHELKNPLTSLRSAVETLPVAKTEATKNQLMKIIQHDVQRLNRLITDISDASRLDAELARDDFQKIDLKEFLTNVILFLKKRDTMKNKEVSIHFTVDTMPSCYYVMGHDLRLSQIITNLIENACSFVPTENGRIDIKLFQSGKYNVISLTDNGIGIRAENIDRIFERFYTDRPEKDSFGENSGLGLSISRQIAEAHGGKIVASNVKNEKEEVIGACFTVMLPKA